MFAFCIVSISPLRKENSDTAEMVSQLLFGELIEVIEINANWSFVRSLHDHYEGWIDTKHYQEIDQEEVNNWKSILTTSTTDFSTLLTPWGKQVISKGSFISKVSSDFKIGQVSFELLTQQVVFEDAITFALTYLNTPYLWGGKNSMGIDCSGYIQQVFRKFNVELPRDAYQQAELGISIPYEARKSNDVAFFHNKKGKITHVGILLEHDQIIHASGQVRIDKLTDEGIQHIDSGLITHPLLCIKRF